MAAIPKRLRDLLYRYRLRWRVVQATMGLLMMFCAILGGVGLGVLVDRLLLGAPRGLRWVFLAAIALAAVALLVRRVLAPVSKRMGDERTAARLGRNFPNMAEDLVTGVELSRDEDSYGVSKGLVDVALNQIDQRSQTVSWRQAVPLDKLARVAALFGVLALAMALAYLFAPEAVSNSVGRLLQPNREDFFSYTKLNVEPGDTVIRKGDAMQVRFTASGRSVTRAAVEVRQTGASFAADVVVVGGVGAWQSAPLLDDLRYRVKAGDNVSRWYAVRTLPSPALISKSVLVTLPAYTARPETTVEGVAGPVTVVNGPERDGVPQPSTVVIQVRPAARGDDPKFACNAWLTAGDQSYPMKPEGGLFVSPRLTPTEDVDYKITLKDGYGLTNRAPETISIKVVPDAKPEVTIPKPGADISQLPGASVPITASATDDFGVRDLKLQTRLVHDKTAPDAAADDWKTLPLTDGGPTQQRLEGSAALLLADFNPIPGDHIEIRAMASDYADEAMFRNGYSEVYRINIISNADHLDMMLDRLLQIADKVDLTARKQGAEAKQTGELKDATAAENKAPEAADAQQRQEELRDKVKGLETQLGEVMADLSDNPLTPAALLSDLGKAESGMDAAESQPMKQASDNLAKAAQSKSGKPDSQQQQQLQEAQKAQKEASEDLEKLSSEISRIQRRKLLEILADEAEQLSRDQMDARNLTGKAATEVGGRLASELSQDDVDRIVRLAGYQKLVSGGIATLDKDIQKVLENLKQENVSEAEKASDALSQMQDDRLTENSEEVASQISENNLFAQTPRQQAIADSLMDLAQTLRTSDDMSQAEKELQEFIKRQKEINARTEKLIGGDVKGADPEEPPPKPPPNPSDSGAMNPEPGRPSIAAVHGPARAQMIRRPTRPIAGVTLAAMAMPAVRVEATAAPLLVAQNSAPAAAPAAAPVPPEVKIVGGRLGEREGMLGQDVSEHSLAMRDLFKEFGLSRIETADKLDQASAEMGLAAQDLPVPSLPEALDHGKKALELLEVAAKSLAADEQHMEQQEKSDEQMSLEEMMQLAKIIGQMKTLHADTGAADRERTQAPSAFPERVMSLARRQGRIRYDTSKIIRKLQARQSPSSQTLEIAGAKMDLSHTALESGDAGSETRKNQSASIQVLEAVLEEQEKSAGSSQQAMSAMQAMHNLSQANHGGGFHGGTNGPLEPARLETAGYQTSTQQKYDDKLAAGFESEFPPEFRGLLNSYFDQVRKETRP